MHLSPERLAALADESPTAAELAHLVESDAIRDIRLLSKEADHVSPVT